MNKQQSGSLHLTKKTDYGLLLLSILANKKTNEQISIKTIAKKNKIPFAFLQKIANSLQKSGIIKSERGKYGGHALAKNPKNITIKAVIESLEGQISIAQCTCTPKIYCERSSICKIKKSLQKINEEIKKYFLSKTLNEIISK